MGLGRTALRAQQAGEARRGAQLEGLRLLRAGDLQGALEEGLGFHLWIADVGLRIVVPRSRIPHSAFRTQENLALQSIQVGIPERLPGLRSDGEPRLDGPVRLSELPGGHVHLAEQSEQGRCASLIARLGTEREPR